MCEHVVTLESKPSHTYGQVTVYPGTGSGLAFLKRQAGIFNSYRVLKCKLLYRPQVGTTEAGTVVVGVSYYTVPASADPRGFHPKMVVPLWQEQSLTLPPGQIMRQRWMETESASQDNVMFHINYSCTKADAGSLYLDYVIELTNPKPVT